MTLHRVVAWFRNDVYHEVRMPEMTITSTVYDRIIRKGNLTHYELQQVKKEDTLAYADLVRKLNNGELTYYEKADCEL